MNGPGETRAGSQLGRPRAEVPLCSWMSGRARLALSYTSMYVYFHVIRASLSLLLMKFPRGFCTLVRAGSLARWFVGCLLKGASCVKAPKWQEGK